MLSTKSIGKVAHAKQRILVESVFTGLLGEKTTIFQLPCLVSADKSTFFVYINNMDSTKFSKTTLFNLVDTAEKTSSQCTKIVFVLLKENNDSFESMDQLFDIIDAQKLSHEEMEVICNKD